MMELLIPLAIGALLLLASISLAIPTWRAGQLKWDQDISRATKRLWLAVFAVACVVILVVFGPAAMLVGWPFFIVAPAITLGVYKLADLAFIRKPKPQAPTVGAPRVIQLQDGRFVMVDQAEGRRWQFLDAPGAPSLPAPRPRSLKRRVADWLLEE